MFCVKYLLVSSMEHTGIKALVMQSEPKKRILLSGSSQFSGGDTLKTSKQANKNDLTVVSDIINKLDANLEKIRKGQSEGMNLCQ